MQQRSLRRDWPSTCSIVSLCGSLCVALLMMGGSIGCGRSESSSPTTQSSSSSGGGGVSKQVTIWWAQWAPSDGLQTLGSDYEKETGVAVKVNQIPWGDYQNQVFMNFTSNQTDFDIVVGDSQWLGRCATQNLY